MKLRTAEQLSDALAGDLAWRKKELTSYRFALESSRDKTDRRDAFLRGAVALLYAHWEGYIKHGGSAYLEFVAAQRLTNAELSIPMLAASTRSLLRRASDSDQIKDHILVTTFLLTKLGERSNLPYKDAIFTRANLSSRVLREIIDTLGLVYAPFESKATLLDEGLLARRNTIAHGSYLMVTLDRYEELVTEVIGMMEEFTTQVTNAAVLGLFRRAA